MSPQDPHIELWVGPCRQTACRRLDQGEATLLDRRLVGELRRVRQAHVASKIVTGIVTFGVGTWFATRAATDGLLAVVFAFLGALPFVLGPAGAALELLFGSRKSRAVFVAAALGAVAGWLVDIPIGRDLGLWGALWLVSIAGVLMMGGTAMLILGLLSRRTRLAELRRALVDVAGGDVQAFERADDRGEQLAAPRTIEVLPLSKLVYSIDGNPCVELLAASVARLGTSSPGAEPGPRGMSTSEVAELERARSRFRRAGIASVLASIWGTAVVLRIIENWLKRSMDPRLSGMGWLFAIAFGAVIAWNRIRLQRAVAADLRQRVVIRAREAGREGSVWTETLPVSKLSWTHDGVPAPWRTVGHP